MKKKLIILSYLFLLLSNIESFASIITTLNKTDPAPIFASDYAYDYLYVNEKEFLKGRTHYDDPLRFNFSVSPFYQRANNGKDLNGKTAELGDISGKMNMLAFLPSGNAITIPVAPPGYTYCNALIEARKNLLSCIEQAYHYNGGQAVPETSGGTPLEIPVQLTTIEGLVSLQDTGRTADQELFGFFSVPMKYRKYGVRVETNAKIFCDFGVSAQTGVANISQVAEFLDQINCPVLPNCTANCPTDQAGIACAGANPFSTLPDSNPVVPSANAWPEILNCLSRDVMNKLQDLAEATKNGLCNYNKTSIEDIHVEAFWRHAYEIQTPSINECLTCGLFIPFVTFGASIPTGAKSDPNQLLSVPFGNNGHYALRFNSGFTFDFTQTIEFGGHAGVAYFLPRKYDEIRMPNNKFQKGIYPFTTSAEVRPGATWHVGIVMNAYNFMDCLSFWGEYLYVTHLHDKITLLNNQVRPEALDCKSPFLNSDANDLFRPDVLECRSPWTAQVLNFALNYDVSRNFKLGALIQMPVQQKHAYKTSTYMISTEIVF